MVPWMRENSCVEVSISQFENTGTAATDVAAAGAVHLVLAVRTIRVTVADQGLDQSHSLVTIESWSWKICGKKHVKNIIC